MTAPVATHRAKATLEVTGADGQPIIIPEKQWYVTPKARPQRMMRNSLSSEARQVYACLELATMGWRQELAVKMDNGKTVPLTASDLIDQTGLSPQNVRRALIELEEQGLGCRRSTDDGPLRKGRVEIYSFAVPRPAQKPKYQSRATGILELDDAELKPLQTFLKRWKITPDPEIPIAREGLKSLSDDIAQWEKTGNALRARAESLCAPSRYKEERKERNGKEYLESHPPAAATTTTEKSDEPAAPLPPAENDVVVVSTKLGVHPSAGKAFVAACRAAAPVCTVEQIVATIDAVDATIDKRTFKNPTGILLKAVPPKLAAEVKAAEEWRAANTVTCWSCHKPIHPEDARMRGAHQACWDAEEVKGTQ
jgi:DNA-binding transcriptional ArsR family regulator